MKNKLIGFFVCILLVGSVVSVSGTVMNNRTNLYTTPNNTLYVGGDGPGNYSSIQDAIDNASEGDTVFVFDDSSPYDESISINKSINLIGEDKVNTIISNKSISVGASGVRLSGFTVQYSYGINIHSGDNNTVSDNIFKSYEEHLGLGGVSLYDTGYNTISDNSFFNCGLYIPSPYENYIFNNTVNGKPLIYLVNTSDNVIEDVGQVFLIGCNNITIKNSEINNLFMGIELINTNNCVFSDNILTDISLFGFTLINSNNNIITKNIISNKLMNNIGIGLFLVGCQYNRISKNFFKNDIGNIWLANTLENNIKYNNFKYVNRRLNIVSLDSDNNWIGNFWNRPRILPVFIWSFNPPRILPTSLDIDWRPAKKQIDINSVEIHRGTQEINILTPKIHIKNAYWDLFTHFINLFPILKTQLYRLGIK